jgi:MFS family permease
MTAQSARDQTTLWRNGSFRWLWLGQGVSQVGSQLSSLAVPVLAVTLLGATEWQVGILGAAQTAAFLLVGLPAGAWIDRVRKRRVLIAADLVRAIALAFVPLLWFTGTLEIWHTYLIAAVLGVATVFFDVSYQSFIPVLLPSNQIGAANSRLEATSQVASIGGPGLGGALLSVVSAPVLLLGDAVSYLVSAVSLWRVRDTEVLHRPEQRVSLRSDIAEGLRFVFGHPILRRIVGTTAASNLFGTLVTTLNAILILRILGLGPVGLGVIFSVGSVGGLLGALATPWLTKRIGEGTAVSVSAIAFGITIFAMPIAGSLPRFALPILIVGTFLEYFLVLVYNITQVTMRQRLTPPRLLGRMNASIRFVVWGVLPIGSLIAGVLGTAIGVLPTMWIGAGGAFFAAVFVLFSPITRMKQLPSDQLANPQVEVVDVAQNVLREPTTDLDREP